MDFLQIVLIVLACVGVWAVVELALVIRKANKVIGELSVSLNDTIDQCQPIITKVDVMMDDLDPGIKQVPELIDNANTTLVLANNILGDVSGATGAVSNVAGGMSNAVSSAANTAVSSVTNAVGRITGKRKGKKKADAQLKAAEEEKPAEKAPEAPAAEAPVEKTDYVVYDEEKKPEAEEAPAEDKAE